MLKDIIEKAKKVVTSPSEFYSGIVKETKIEPAFKYYMVLLLINSIIGTIIGGLFSSLITSSTFLGLPVNRPQNTTGAGGILFTIPFVIIGYILSGLLSFVIAGIIHLWIKLFGGKGTYTRTYQLYIYSDTPYLLLGWVPIVNFVARIYGFIILIIGTAKLHNMKTRKVVIMYLIPMVILFVLLITGLIAAFSFIRNLPVNQV